MQTNEASIFLFIASIIIGLLIAMNMNLGKGSKLLGVEEYEVAYNERIKLQGEIYNLQEQYLELTDKVNDFEMNSKSNKDILGDITEELKKNRIVLGKVPVKGEGVKITLSDAPEVMFGGNYTTGMLVHDTDLVMVINDLRSAGAEAIAINDQRIVFNSSGICWGPSIRFDGVNVIGPFYITAIGNKDVLKSFLDTQKNQVKELKTRKCYVEVETSPEIIIPAYNSSTENKYILPYKEK
ncbi:DUF881 domain-containing protein [Clostridium tunisiense]|uniref:DUF881 domain-containing protein n=1 Tax=Clostridium tunisiense TaxID=219748 RepID=UPI00030D3ED8|nr:DUF881 domain-containing protein [Clostridium tunisiense]